VAAMAGFHPYKKLPDTMVKYVYQGRLGQQLLQQDAIAANISIVSREDQLMAIASKSGSQDVRTIVQQVLSGSKRPENTTQATELKQSVVKAVEKPEVKAKLTKEELKMLTEGTRQTVDTQYGSRHEDYALDMYSQQIGEPVRERNSSLLEWPFEKDHTSALIPLQPKASPCVFPKPTSPDRYQFRSRPDRDVSSFSAQDVFELFLNGGVPGANASPYHTSSPRSSSGGKRPFLYIRGVVDGIRDEVVPTTRTASVAKANDYCFDDDSWILRQVIVECKHRMHKILAVPPLYDMIQAVTYCLMCDTSEADLVQVLRPGSDDRKRSPSEMESQCEDDEADEQEANASGGEIGDEQTAQPRSTSEKTLPVGDVDSNENKDSSAIEETTNASNGSKSGTESTLEFHVTRVSVDDPILRHRQNWTSIVLPRLRSFVDAVYRIRADYTKRTLLLASVTNDPVSMEAGWMLLHSECPWLESSDTAFNRSHSSGTAQGNSST